MRFLSCHGVTIQIEAKEMPKQISQETERLANGFVSYLFDEYQGTKHVHRVATWIGGFWGQYTELP